jgi:hypothetical protein
MVTFENFVNKLVGGKSDNRDIDDIAKLHDVPVEEIEKQLKIGIGVESEHTKDKEVAREVAMDHLFEFPRYYTELSKMEAKLKKDEQ